MRVMSWHSTVWWRSNRTSLGPRRNRTFPAWGALRCVAAVLGLLGGLSPEPTQAETNGTPQILFLHLKVKNQTVSLVDSATRPGVLKRPRQAAADDLHYEVLSATSNSLWKAAVLDPTLRRLEYEEPPGSGNLKRKTVVSDEADFTIRIPLSPEARRVDFYTLESSAPAAKGEKAVARKSLGSVVLP